MSAAVRLRPRVAEATLDAIVSAIDACEPSSTDRCMFRVARLLAEFIPATFVDCGAVNTLLVGVIVRGLIAKHHERGVYADDLADIAKMLGCDAPSGRHRVAPRCGTGIAPGRGGR